jgi:large subunit ribosomal protein L17
MRHQKKTVKLGVTAAHRKSLLANQVCSLIEHQRIKTTLAKAKAVRPLAERMVTLGKTGTLHARRTALAVLKQKDAVKKLFDDIAPRSTDRKGGYTRIIKLGQRKSDSASVAFLEWVDAPKPEAEEPKPDEKGGKRASKSPNAEASSDVGSKPVKKAKKTAAAKQEQAEE